MKCGDIFGFKMITETAISPAGDAVAYVQRTAHRELDTYQSELLLARVPGMPNTSTCGSVGAGLHSPAWAPDGRRIAAVEHHPGDTTDSLVIVSARDGSKSRILSGLIRPGSITWSPDGNEVGYLAISAPKDDSPHTRTAPTVVTDLSAKIDGLGITRSWQRHLFAVDFNTGSVRQMTDGDLWIEDFCYSPSSSVIALCGSGPWAGPIPRQPGAVRPSTLWLLSRMGGAMLPLATGEASARSLRFAGDEHLVFTGGPAQRADLFGLYLLGLDGGTVRQMARALDRGIAAGSASFLRASADRGLVFCARDGGSMRLYSTSLRNPEAARELAGSAFESITAVSASDHGVLAYVSGTADGSQRLTIHDLRSGSRTALAETAPPAEVLPAAGEEFTARDGLKVQGWLIRSKVPGKTPLLVDVHGGSFSGAWSPIVQPSRLYQHELARNGWTVLLLNPRGSDGYGSEFARAALGSWGVADAPDFHDAIDALIGQKLVDPGKLAVTGYSYGGFMSNWLTATSDRFSAAVSGGSICNFVSLFGTSDMGWAMSEYDIGVRPHVDPLGALRRSPAGIGRPVLTPTLLLHGEADLRCPISQAEEWLALLLAAGSEAALVRYPGVGHGFLTDGPPSLAVDYGNRLVQWLTSHVSGN
jgi:dipeptidyl aminopeptidase/acylaminoacyl peptidase